MAEGLLGGRIALGEEIGRGAMGVVYKAELNGSDVAVKVLHHHLTSDLAVVGRFVREHQALSRIDHPNVVRVIELVVDDPRLGIVMEYLNHPDLGKVITSGIDSRRAVKLAAGIAAGVSAIHDADVAHRDMKPANVIVAQATGDDGTVHEIPKIADFGVSRLIGSSIASSTTTLGTPLYMSPEATGGSTPIGRPSDIYSLGVMLFEMLTGHPPYRAEEPIAIAVAHVKNPVPVLGGVPDELSELLQAMLAKESADRPDAATVADTLEALATTVDVDLDPVVLNEPVLDLRDLQESTSPGSTSKRFQVDETVGDYTRPPGSGSSATVLVTSSNPGPSALLDGDGRGPGPGSSGNAGSFGYPAGNAGHDNGREGRSILGYGPPERPGNGAGGAGPVWTTPGSSYPPPLVRLNRRDLGSTTASSVRRSWPTFGLIALAVLLAVSLGWFAFSRSRSGAADVGAGTTDAAFSFMPHLGANGLITTRRWELGVDGQGRRIIDAEVIVANSGSGPVDATHYEAFPEVVDAQHLVSTFRPEPDDVLTDSGVAVFEIGELAPRARFVLVYNMLAADNITSVEELQALAESQLAVETEFLESLPAQAAQEAMETDGVLASLTLSPTRLELAVGEVGTADLLGTLSDGTAVDPAALASAVWVVADPAVAEVTNNNSIRGLREGRTAVTVSVGEIQTTLSLTVAPSEVAAATPTSRPATSSTVSSRSPTTTSATTASSSSTNTTVGSSTSSTATTAPSTTETTAGSSTSTSTTTGEAPLTMSSLGVQVNGDGSFKITFTTNLCTIANYQGAGQSYITPGWPEVTGPCWESHGQNFTAVAPGSYEIVVRSRSEGGQQARRTATVVVTQP